MPGPQILGWFVELTTPGNSTPLVFDPSKDSAPSGGITAAASDISIINFVKQLTKLSS